MTMNAQPNIQPITQSQARDRFFVARVDGQDTLFVLHADHSVRIAMMPGPVTIEPAEQLIAELSGLAA
jgi:hypothetical protein